MYKLNAQTAQNARKADAGGSIRDTGKYVGKITQAYEIKTKRGGKGVSLTFQTEAGQKANLALYTLSPEGETYQGFDTLMAMMTCMRVKEVTPKDGVVMVYDFDQRMEVKRNALVLSELCANIGLLLEKEEYEKTNGDIGERMVIKNVFQADTELTAAEILDKKTAPEALPRLVANLKDRPLKPQRKQHQGDYQGAPVAQRDTSGFDDMDDDIPF